MAQPVLGAILAGGRSLRMGEDKLLLEIDGVPSVLHIAAALSVVASDIVVVGRAGTWFGLPGIPTWDRLPRSAGRDRRRSLFLRVAGWVAVAGVDQPWLRPATLVELARLAEGYRGMSGRRGFRRSPVPSTPLGGPIPPPSCSPPVALPRLCSTISPGGRWNRPNGRAGERTAGRGSRWTRRLGSPKVCHGLASLSRPALQPDLDHGLAPKCHGRGD